MTKVVDLNSVYRWHQFLVMNVLHKRPGQTFNLS